MAATYSLITIPESRPHHQGRLRGQDFALTGWKIGFVCAAPAAVARSLRRCTSFSPHHRAQSSSGGRLWPWQAGGSFLSNAQRIGTKAATVSPRTGEYRLPGPSVQGTYFLTVDPLAARPQRDRRGILASASWTDYKVAAIPVSAFYEKDAVTSVVRFCFAKKMHSRHRAGAPVERGASPIRVVK